MEQIIKTCNVKIVREPGSNPITGQIFDYAEEKMMIDAINLQQAHRIAQLLMTLQFQGQRMRMYIDGQEHLDEKL